MRQPSRTMTKVSFSWALPALGSRRWPPASSEMAGVCSTTSKCVWTRNGERSSDSLVQSRHPEGREVVSSLGVVDSPPPPALRTWLVRPESLGSRWTSEAIPTAIYDLQRRPGPVQVGVVPPEIAFEILCQNSLDLMANIPAGLGALSWLAASVPLARLRYDEGEDAVRTLNLNLATISNWHAVEAQVEQPRLAEEDPAPIGRGNPSDHVYSVTMGDRVVLFDPRSRVVARLDRKGSMIWNRTAHPRRRVRGRRQLSEQLRAIGIAS